MFPELGAAPKNYLLLRFRNDGDGSGKLFAQAAVAGFSGTSAAYFDIEALEKFAAAMQTFPLESGNSCSISAGLGNTDDASNPNHEHLGITVYPIDNRGHIGVHVRLATEVWSDTRPEEQRIASVELLTSYEPLRAFGRKLLSLVRAKADEAILDGEDRN